MGEEVIVVMAGGGGAGGGGEEEGERGGGGDQLGGDIHIHLQSHLGDLAVWTTDHINPEMLALGLTPYVHRRACICAQITRSLNEWSMTQHDRRRLSAAGGSVFFL